MSEHERIDPLPETWLPEPSGPPDDAPAWEARLRRIVAAAGPRLERLRERAEPGVAGGAPGRGDRAWWAGLGLLLRPAAGLAAAAGLLLFLVQPAPSPAGEGADSPTLAAVASGGEPAALWQATGAEADPVLALIALEEGTE